MYKGNEQADVQKAKSKPECFIVFEIKTSLKDLNRLDMALCELEKRSLRTVHR